MGIELTNEQIYATYDAETWFRSSTSNQVFEISGPAGSGKTTLVLYIIERLGLKIKDVLFCAYMGKAASQLIMHGLPAVTIHSAVYDVVKEMVKDENGRIVFDSRGKPKMKNVFRKREKLYHDYKLIVVDEGSTVDGNIAEDLLSFGIPVIVLGDLNQLPPVIGKPFFLKNPDVILTKIMRQNEDNPIIYLSQRVLNNEPLHIGVYGKSSVIKRDTLRLSNMRDADVILTCTNRLRYNVNTVYREKIKKIQKLDFPSIGEKMVCRKNNWKKCIDDTFYLTNGTTGFVEYFDRSTFNGKSFEMDFKPDFIENRSFKHLNVDYNHLYRIPGQVEENPDKYFYYDKFEYAYALTVHISQGSQYGNVLFLSENMMRSREEEKRLKYTAITRAIDKITVAL